MKKILLFVVLISALLTSCNTEESTIPTPRKEYVISLGFGGEITSITTSDMMKLKMLRSEIGVSSNDLIAIQVYSLPISKTCDVEDTLMFWRINRTPYAFGLFDKTENISIKLLDGFKYRFECKILPNGKSIFDIPFDSIIEPSNCPFNLSTSMNYNYSKFNYSSFYYQNLNYSAIVIDDKYYQRPNIPIYYGNLLDYIPTSNKTANLQMYKMNFGVKVVAEGFTEGKIETNIEGSHLLTFDYPTTEAQDIFTFSDLYDVNLSNYEEVLTSIIWQKQNGERVPLAQQKIKYYLNKITTIKLSLKDSLVSNGLGFIINDGEMTPSDTIQIGGSTTDTGVELNP